MGCALLPPWLWLTRAAATKSNGPALSRYGRSAFQVDRVAFRLEAALLTASTIEALSRKVKGGIVSAAWRCDRSGLAI